MQQQNIYLSATYINTENTNLDKWNNKVFLILEETNIPPEKVIYFR